MSEIVVRTEVYSPLSRVVAVQSDLRSALRYWPHLVDCEPAGEGVWTITYALGRRRLAATASVTASPRGLLVELEGGLRGRVTVEYVPTAMTRTMVTTRVDVRVHGGLVGQAFDRLLAGEQLTADAEGAGANLATMLAAETTPIVAALTAFVDLPPEQRVGEVRLLDRDWGLCGTCSGPTAEGACALTDGPTVACAGKRVLPPGAGDVAWWALASRPGAEACPLAWAQAPVAVAV